MIIDITKLIRYSTYSHRENISITTIVNFIKQGKLTGVDIDGAKFIFDPKKQ